MLFPLQEHGGEGHGGGHHEEAPHTIFTKIWESVKDTGFGKLYHFDDPELGQFWFDAIGFSLIAAILLVVCATMATKTYTKIPRGIQNVFEWVVGLLRSLVQGFIPGAQGERYLEGLKIEGVAGLGGELMEVRTVAGTELAANLAVESDGRCGRQVRQAE